MLATYEPLTALSLWRWLRAEELRAIADSMITLDAKDGLLKLADGLDAMATRNEALESGAG
jgi:hypothetical protein